MDKVRWPSWEWLSCVHYGLGIIATMGAYSFLQATMFLVLCNRLVSIVYALCMMFCLGESWKIQAPVWKYVVVSFSNMLSTWCQYESLRYVSLILQTMAKTFKMLPVMLIGVVVSNKRPPAREFMVVLFLTLGITLFVVGGSISSEHAEGSSYYGLGLLLAFLGFDGFTSNFQEKLFWQDKMSKYNQMLYMNMSSAVVSATVLWCFHSFAYCFSFILQHPPFIWHVAGLSVAAAAGQFYIFSMVHDFGALALAAAMNARQVLTIFGSYALDPGALSWLQLLGLLVLGGSLWLKVYCSFQVARRKAAVKATTPTIRDANVAEEATELMEKDVELTVFGVPEDLRDSRSRSGSTLGDHTPVPPFRSESR
ncbi:unnamed protein product [Effrenium voratum]|nr:unnamed protein product [Effrenium voratum]